MLELLRRYVGWVLGCVLVSSWLACGSTETGNPPFLNMDDLGLHMVGDAVEISGGPGTVKPGGTLIEITDLGNHATASTRSKPDGSFSVTLPGASGQGFSIRLSNADGKVEVPWHPSVAPIDAGSSEGGSSDAVLEPPQPDAGLVTQPEASVASGQPGSQDGAVADAAPDQAVCTDLQTQAQNRIQTAVFGALNCQAASDCVVVPLKTACATACDTAVAVAAQQSLADELTKIDAEICQQAAGCAVPSNTCPSPGTSPECIENLCVLNQGPMVISVGGR